MGSKGQPVGESAGAVERLIDSYETRFRAVSLFLERAVEVIAEYRGDLDGVIAMLRDQYASKVSLRRRDFDRVVSEPLRLLQGSEKRVLEALESFQREEEAMIKALRDTLAEQAAQPVRWELLRDRLVERQQSREAALTRLLRDYHVELVRLMEIFGVILKKHRRPQVRDLKRLVGTAAREHTFEQTQMARSIRDLEEEQDRIRRQWGEVLAVTTMEGR